jgi:hypothetical protein
MERHLIDKLVANYPHLFPNGWVGSAIMDGWYGILDEACANLESLIVQTDDPGKYYCVQIKEKMGSLTIHLNDCTQEMSKVLGDALVASSKTCEYCGEPGTIRLDEGWRKCLCTGHRDYRRLERENGRLRQRLRYFSKLGEKLKKSDGWLTNLAEIWREEDDPDRPGQTRKVLVEKVTLDTYQLIKAYEETNGGEST